MAGIEPHETPEAEVHRELPPPQDQAPGPRGGQADAAERVDLLAERDRRIEQLEAMVSGVVARQALREALQRRGVGRGARSPGRVLDQAVGLLEHGVRVEFDGGRPRAVVVDNAACGGVERYVDDWLASDGEHFLPGTADTGSGAVPGAPPATGPTPEQLDRDVGAKAEFIARHGVGAYVRLARGRANHRHPH